MKDDRSMALYACARKQVMVPSWSASTLCCSCAFDQSIALHTCGTNAHAISINYVFFLTRAWVLACVCVCTRANTKLFALLRRRLHDQSFFFVFERWHEFDPVRVVVYELTQYFQPMYCLVDINVLYDIYNSNN